jgi:hypothetical protein
VFVCYIGLDMLCCFLACGGCEGLFGFCVRFFWFGLSGLWVIFGVVLGFEDAVVDGSESES